MMTRFFYLDNCWTPVVARGWGKCPGWKGLCPGWKGLCLGWKGLCLGWKGLCLGWKGLCLGWKGLCPGWKGLCPGWKGLCSSWQSRPKWERNAQFFEGAQSKFWCPPWLCPGSWKILAPPLLKSWMLNLVSSFITSLARWWTEPCNIFCCV